MPTAAETALSRGLEGVVANESAICYVFGQEGRLIYRGYDIHDLADNSTFEETAFLLLKGDLPTRDQLKEFVGQVKAAQKVDKVVQGVIKDAPLGANPMNVLRTAVSAAVFGDPDRTDNSAAGEYRRRCGSSRSSRRWWPCSTGCATARSPWRHAAASPWRRTSSI